MKTVAVHLRLENASHRKRMMGIFRHIASPECWNIRIIQNEENLLSQLTAVQPVDLSDGIISCSPKNPKTIEAIVRSGIPFVGIGMSHDILTGRTEGIGCVVNDNGEIGRTAAEYFLSLGNFRSYVFAPDTQEREWSHHRGEAFATALHRSGKNCIFAPAKADTAKLAGFIDSLPRPVAVLAAWDGRAADTIHAAHHAGLEIPKDISILGVDDDELICTHTVPPLSSIRTAAESMGETAAVMLNRLMTQNTRHKASTVCCPIAGITERGSTRTPSPASSLIRRAIEIIEAEAANGISPDGIARRLNISRRLLDLRFHQYESTSITEMIANRRIDTAKRLLANPHTSIKDVFRSAGFGNISYATRLFRKRTGLSPHDWRLSLRQQDDTPPGKTVGIERLTTLSEQDAKRMAELTAQLSPEAKFNAQAVLNSIRRGETTVFVLRNRKRIVASATAVCFSTPTGNHCRIEDVVVDTKMRGKGLGRKLMQETLNVLRTLNVRHIELTSRQSRVAATTLYRSLGFTPRQTGVYELNIKQR